MDATRRDELEALLRRLGLEPAGGAAVLLDQALTHRSFAAEHEGVRDNERLEFLGDAVLGLACAEYLYECYPLGTEGDLSRLRAVMVSRRVLGTIGREMGLGELLRLGVGESATGGRERDSVVGSALEAVVGALSRVYKWETLRRPLRLSVLEVAQQLADSEESRRGNYKSRLQEIVQRERNGEVPLYEVHEVAGPDHDRMFVVAVSVGGEVLGSGRGARIRWAENEAARMALEKLGQG